MRDQLDLPHRPVLFLSDFADAAGTWARLAAWLNAGVGSPKHPFHWPAVSTVAADGTPESRVVVLRRFDPAARTVTFHTDVRSPKVEHLRHTPRCAFLFFDPDAHLQLRLRATAAVHHADAVARREFGDLLPHTRATYAGLGPPGEPLPPDAPFDYPPRPPVDEESAFGHFAAVVCAVVDADAVELHENGHRRAKLWWEAGEVRARRVRP